MNEVIFIVALLLLVFLMGIGIFYYAHLKQTVYKLKQLEEEDKGLLHFSESKIIEVPVRKEKSPLYVFKDGKRQLFVLKKGEKEKKI